MILGTHNSGTGGKLVWWQRPFAPILNLTSRCQEKSIAEQIMDGVKVFNLQVTYYNKEWHFSHGLCIYKERLFQALGRMRAAASRREPVYFQLYLDKNFFCKQNEEKFQKLVKDIKDYYCTPYFVMLTAWVEGSKKYLHKARTKIEKSEQYWTKEWSRKFSNSFIDRLPLPYRHAKKYNTFYRRDCDCKYLMLDFYNV